MAAEEVGGGHRLLAGHLNNEQANVTLAGRHDQAVGLGNDNGARRTGSWDGLASG